MAEQRDFIIRNGLGTDAKADFYIGPAEGEESVVHGWEANVDAATGFETHEAAVDERAFVEAEGGYTGLEIVERDTARRELNEAQERRDAPRRAAESRESWFQQTGATVRSMISRLTQAETTTPALTPEGKSLGFEWEKGTGAPGSALLWPDASEAMKTGPLAALDHLHPAAGWTISDVDAGFERNEAMIMAEVIAAERVIEPLSEASESYYAKLADLAESRGADMERGNDFDIER